MKKSFLLTFSAFVIFSLQTKAQFSKGTIMLGTTIGTTGYSSANSDYGYDVGTLKTPAPIRLLLVWGHRLAFFFLHILCWELLRLSASAILT